MRGVRGLLALLVLLVPVTAQGTPFLINSSVELAFVLALTP
jgi:hypothetical protein